MDENQTEVVNRTTRILIIEDDEDFSSILRRVIEQDAELQVVEVINCEEEALSRVKSPNIHQVDCVLLDLQLPMSRGDKTVSSLAGIRIRQPVLADHRQAIWNWSER